MPELVLMAAQTLVSLAIGVFAWQTVRVYRQIRDLERYQIEAAYRPLLLPVLREGEHTAPNHQRWRGQVIVKNIGQGLAMEIEVHSGGETFEVPYSLEPGHAADGVGRSSREWTEQPRVEVSYRDFFGNRYRTIWRGRQYSVVEEGRSKLAASG